MISHEIDYKIFGEEMQFVEFELDPQEGVIAESGTFMMMDDQIRMNTIFGDGSKQEKGILGKLFSAGKRVLTGESLFMTVFTNDGFGKKQISFASPYPGKIIPIDLMRQTLNPEKKVEIESSSLNNKGTVDSLLLVVNQILNLEPLKK